MTGIGQFLKCWLLEVGVEVDIRRENGVAEGKEGEVEVPHLLARLSNVFDQEQLRG